jgi:hypothetical protein
MTFVGKFEVPELLVEFANLDGTVPDFTVSYIGIDRVHDDCRWFPYSTTPLDLLQFAWTGCDGIHFGFLTDFGAVADLEQAPIVCVSPSTRPPLTLVARNLYEFLCALCEVKEGPNFSDLQYHFGRAGDPWWNTFGLDPQDETHEEQLRTARIVRERLHLREMPDYRGYLADLWAERARSISLETADGLGILRTARSSSAVPERFDFDAEANKTLDAMRAYLSRASYDATLAFCRDAQWNYDFLPGRRDDVRLLVADALCALGLGFEGERVRTFGK